MNSVWLYWVVIPHTSFDYIVIFCHVKHCIIDKIDKAWYYGFANGSDNDSDTVSEDLK